MSSLFKKPPAGLDYKTARHGPVSKKDRERQARRAAAAELQTGGAEEEPLKSADDDRPEPNEPMPTLAVVATEQPSSAQSEPNPKPTPKPVADPEAESSPSPETPPVEEKTVGTVPEAEAPARGKTQSPVTKARKKAPWGAKIGNSGSVEVLGYVYCPLNGAFDTFDKLVNAYGERDALGLAITAGLEELDRLLVAGATVEPTPDYSTRRARIRIRRRLSVEAVDRALAHLDPFGMLSQYQFGTRLWKSALGLYLVKG